MVRDKLVKDLKKVIETLGFESFSDPVLSISENSKFGDYTTNIAFQLSKQKSENDKQSPEEVANDILRVLGPTDYLDKSEVAGKGFINFFVKDKVLVSEFGDYYNLPQASVKKKILVEYGHVNPLKEIHIGHLRTFILGEAVARIFESLGHEVFRANYQGDIGLHIAKAIWGALKLGVPSADLSYAEKAEFMGRAYAEGHLAYEGDPNYKREIDGINKGLYQKDSKLDSLYYLTRDWSLEYFQPIYELLGIRYDRCFFESEVYQRGKELVLENIGKVFKESEGAVIFPGEDYGLHNRVFITQVGSPTYEGKEVGLAELEYETFKYDLAVHVVAHEQAGYFKVVFKAIELLFPELSGKKYHLSYGLVGLKEGKMSSRTGNVVTVDDLVGVVSEKVREVISGNEKVIDQSVVRQVAVGAIKYSYLKVSPAPNMVFDLEESVSLRGDSGPYIQYTYARTQSVLKNASLAKDQVLGGIKLEGEERKLVIKLSDFGQVLSKTADFRPNLLCEYLAGLSAAYNLFYQKHRIIDSDKAGFRLEITRVVGEVLRIGLGVLGIEAPTRM